MSSPAYEVSGATYVYRGSAAGVHDVSLTIPRGTIYGLLGVNGAGKTTLMRLMLGLLEPQRGSIRCLGDAIGASTHRRVGSLIENPSLYLHLTAREHLRVFAEYNRVPHARIDEVLALVDLRDGIVSRFSLGMKQRLALATALLHDPEVLVLDEPANGLDPLGIVSLRELLLRLAADGKTVVISSHLLAEVEKLATHMAVIHEGRIRFDGPMSGAGTLEEDFLRYVRA